jgi:protein O-GlcNAc transferase
MNPTAPSDPPARTAHRREQLETGWQKLGQSDLPGAEAAARLGLQQHPEDAEFLRLYGRAVLLQGRPKDALAPLRSVLRGAAIRGDGYFLGQCYLALGDAESARGILEGETRAYPDLAEAHNLLGVALAMQARYEEARSSFAAAVAGNPRLVDARSNLGSALLKLERNEEAIACLLGAIELQSGYAPDHDNLGVAYRQTNRLEEAAACHRKAVSLAPQWADAHVNLGLDYHLGGRFSEAIECYRRAIEINPDNAIAHAGLGDAYHESGQFEAAIASRRKAISIKPGFSHAHVALGVTYHAMNRLEEAVACYRKALALGTESFEVYYSLGAALRDEGAREEAIDCLRKALSLNPESPEAHWLYTMTQIPVVCSIGDDPARCRAQFSMELDSLETWVDAGRIGNCHNVVGAQTPFYLAYEETSNRDLLGRHGSLCARIMADWRAHQDFPPPRPRNSVEVVRVGVVSRHFYSHPVWNAIVKGWFEQIDPRRFSLEAFCLGLEEDAETLIAKTRATHFEQGRRPLRQWAEIILAKQLDVLIYPEIGIDAMTVQLANLRLAPVQIAAWGHPCTTGIPAMDHYLSAEDFEPADAQDHYTERLLALPHLGCFYRSPPVTAAPCDLADLGIPEDAPLLLCPGTPFKYAPRHDCVLPEIARRLGRCRFVFFVHRTPNLSERLRQRLRSAFAKHRLELDDFASFIPWQEAAAFYGLLKRADVVLDTIGFSGFNTAMQAVECGAPIVTREGRFMRGRFASGILKRMGLRELVAASEQDYVGLAVRMAEDEGYRRQVRQRIDANRRMLFEDVVPIRVLEDFLISVGPGRR